MKKLSASDLSFNGFTLLEIIIVAAISGLILVFGYFIYSIAVHYLENTMETQLKNETLQSFYFIIDQDIKKSNYIHFNENNNEIELKYTTKTIKWRKENDHIIRSIINSDLDTFFISIVDISVKHKSHFFDHQLVETIQFQFDDKQHLYDFFFRKEYDAESLLNYGKN